MLGAWSTTKILSFGTHLYLLEKVTATISEEEVARPIRSRISNFLLRSREFVNSFEEWRAYSNQSVEFALEENGNSVEIRQNLDRIANALSNGGGSIEPRIPKALGQYAELTGVKVKKTYSVGLISALGSVKNISISLIKYAINIAQKGTVLLKNDKAVELLQVICNALPRLTALAHITSSLSFLLAHVGELKLACEVLATFRKKAANNSA